MNRDLVIKHYPWFLDTFDNLPAGIMRADSSRILYMHHEGGNSHFLQLFGV
jgi:mannosyltransferase OCH1-like enzyme